MKMGRMKELLIDAEITDEILKLEAYIEISTYRLKVLTAIGNKVLMPTEIAKVSGIRTNHISNVLKQLKSVELVICINEEVKKGRLYKLTPLGLVIYSDFIKKGKVKLE